MLMRRAVRITRQAISPRLAMRILENILGCSICWKLGENEPHSLRRLPIRDIGILKSGLEFGQAWIAVHPAICRQADNVVDQAREGRVNHRALQAEFLKIVSLSECNFVPKMKGFQDLLGALLAVIEGVVDQRRRGLPQVEGGPQIGSSYREPFTAGQVPFAIRRHRGSCLLPRLSRAGKL